MTWKYSKDLKQTLYPYIFVLQEGDLKDDGFDYSLMMFQVGSPETLKSPGQAIKPLRQPVIPVMELARESQMASSRA